jgi:YesN/AraC family two-component response regulator
VQRLNTFWVDLTIAELRAELPASLASRCRFSRAHRTQALGPQVQRSRPDVVFFDFDYPDQTSLRLATGLKQEHPSIPMVMMSVQHSEALAVWAFRSRFADYLVKPVPQAEFDRCLDMLEEMLDGRRAQPGRRIASQPVAMPEEAPVSSVPSSALLPAVYHVQKNYHAKITSDDAARLCGMSPFRFGRAFKDAFGVAFRDYVVSVRLEEAGRLLENPQTSVTEVAYAVGFNDISYFSRMFKRHFGISPSMRVDPSAKPPPAAALPLELPPLLLPPSSAARGQLVE